MSEKKTNRKAILLGALIVTVLIGICFFCVTLYAKKEINKPKFDMPKQAEQPSVTALPADKDEACAYVSRLYEAALASDDTEASWHTDVRLNGEWDTPFSDADEAILLHICDGAAGQIAALYPNVSDLRTSAADNVPRPEIAAQSVLGFTAEQGRTQDDGKIVDTDRYFISLTVDPQSADTQAMLNSEVFKEIEKELSTVASLSDTQIEAQDVTMRFTIDRVSDQLLSAEIERNVLVTTTIRLTEASSALLSTRQGKLSLPYGTTQHIDFKHYGTRFLKRAMVVKPGDMKALPADVRVNANAMKEDYKLTFTASEPDVLSFDADGVMTVNKTFDDPVTVTMTLEYDGHTYTDELIVYISEWEVATDVGA